MRNNSKIVVGAVTASTTGVSTISAEFDTKGFSFARVFLLSEATTAIHTAATNSSVTESDTSGSGFAAIPGLVHGTDYTPLTTSNLTSVAKTMYNIDLRGRKRYLKVTCGIGATNFALTLAADLSYPQDGISSATDAGAHTAFGI